MDCCAPPAPAPAIDCRQYPLSCDAGACALKFTYEHSAAIDLGKEVPALAGAAAKVLSDILLKELDLTVASSFNVALPPVSLFVAPANVTSGANPGARKIATLRMFPAGYRGQERVPLDAQAQQAFSDFAKNFQTPFNMIFSTTVTVKGGTPAPQGQLDVTVSGKVEARI